MISEICNYLVSETMCCVGFITGGVSVVVEGVY